MVAVDVVAGGWNAVFLLEISLVMTCSGGAEMGVVIAEGGSASGFKSARMPSFLPYSIINALGWNIGIMATLVSCVVNAGKGETTR